VGRKEEAEAQSIKSKEGSKKDLRPKLGGGMHSLSSFSPLTREKEVIALCPFFCFNREEEGKREKEINL